MLSRKPGGDARERKDAACQCSLIPAPTLVRGRACPRYDMTGDSSQGLGARSGSLDTIDGTLSGCDSDIGGTLTTSRQTTPDAYEEMACSTQPEGHARNAQDAQSPRHARNVEAGIRWSDLDAMASDATSGHGCQSKTGDPTAIDVTVDPGAVEVVAPPRFERAYPTHHSRGSRVGVQYRIASGAMVTNLGEHEVRMMAIEGGGVRAMIFQAADVTRRLASGGRSVLDDEDAYIQHKATGNIFDSTRRAMSSSCA